ncbi:hypothetical protein ACIREE_40740 [Streptomyces sp. NPDC102467]|uniref:hypothetical protein n=1 Tax=Streptomyces sp. NPDC102467 TaxID=3366179 RepID=UPI00381785D0
MSERARELLKFFTPRDPAELARFVRLWVWAPREDAFNDGLTAAKAWAEVHGHFLPPATAMWNDYPVGNMRDAARLADRIAARREAGTPAGSEAGGAHRGAAPTAG